MSTIQRFYDPVTDTTVAFDDNGAAEVNSFGMVTVTPFTPGTPVSFAVALTATRPAKS